MVHRTARRLKTWNLKFSLSHLLIVTLADFDGDHRITYPGTTIENGTVYFAMGGTPVALTIRLVNPQPLRGLTRSEERRHVLGLTRKVVVTRVAPLIGLRVILSNFSFHHERLSSHWNITEASINAP